jgi:hypothetical protein
MTETDSSNRLQDLAGHRLATFCKVLSLTISDLDMYDQKSTLYQQNLLKRSIDFMPVRDVNQVGRLFSNCASETVKARPFPITLSLFFSIKTAYLCLKPLQSPHTPISMSNHLLSLPKG